jgi:hypothetical protein
MENVFDMKVEKPNIIGSTTINHAARRQLELNCSEYVLMDWIARRVETNKDTNVTSCFLQIGFTDREMEVVTRSLVAKGFILPLQTNPPTITDKWKTAFTSLESEFEEYIWKLKGKVFFTGSKKKGCEMYIKLRKKYSRDFLHQQRNDYAEVLELTNKTGFDRNVMIITRWLGESEQPYLSDWKNEIEKLQTKLKKINGEPIIATSNPEVITQEERKHAYENSNQ